MRKRSEDTVLHDVKENDQTSWTEVPGPPVPRGERMTDFHICTFFESNEVVNINGVDMPFEMTTHFGPCWLQKDGEIRERQPSPRNLFWTAVPMWAQQGKRRCAHCQRCLWHPEPTDVTVPLRGRQFRLVSTVFQPDRCLVKFPEVVDADLQA